MKPPARGPNTNDPSTMSPDELHRAIMRSAEHARFNGTKETIDHCMDLVGRVKDPADKMHSLVQIEGITDRNSPFEARVLRNIAEIQEQRLRQGQQLAPMAGNGSIHRRLDGHSHVDISRVHQQQRQKNQHPGMAKRSSGPSTS